MRLRAGGEGKSSLALTVDLGNTRAKLCLFDLGIPGAGGSGAVTGEPIRSSVFPWSAREGTIDALGRWIAESRVELEREIGLAVLSSVAGAQRTEDVCSELERAQVASICLAPEAGVANETLTPATVGHDRLFGARAAADWLRARPASLRAPGVLVVDAGTALTVDAVLLTKAGEARFLGGAIAPGPALLGEALARGAANLPDIKPHPGASAFGRDTPGAIQAGVVVGFRGAAARLVEELGQATGLGAAPILVTGGARSFLFEPDPFLLDRELVVDAWLVERGLLAAAHSAQLGVERR
jgi:pantothenate kinase type III